jgi:Arc/MetJ-type ribon-helix-helix transcriptional regulator
MTPFYERHAIITGKRCFMTVSLKPELQKLVEEKVKAGLFPSAEALVNFAVEQLITEDDLEPGEMERLLAVGEEQARQGRLVELPRNR